MNELIVEKPEALDYYLECLSVQLGMQNFVLSNFDVSQQSEDHSVLQETIKLDMYETAIHDLIVETEAAERALREKLERQRRLLSTRENPVPPKPWWHVAFKVAAILMIAGGIVQLDRLSREHPKPVPTAVAHLTSSIDAQWTDSSLSYIEGDKIYPGPISLLDGFVNISLEKGVQVVVQAPARLDIKSSREIYLEEGQIAVNIQDSTDPFVVQTPRAIITDYGTEFGVYVDRDGITESSVFEGKIELRNRTDAHRLETRLEKTLLLYAGHAAVVNKTGSIKAKETPSCNYVRDKEYRIKLKASQGSAYHRWLAYTYQVERDPGLVAYYKFEKDLMNPGLLHNSTVRTSRKLDGTLGDEKSPAARPTWVEGRWPQKGALQFNATNRQYVRLPADAQLAIPGDLSIVWWMKADPQLASRTAVIVGYGGKGKFENFYYSHGLEQGRYRAFHEQGAEESGDDYAKNDIEVLTDAAADFDRWVQVAIVRDAATKQYHFYIDGEWIESHSYDKNCDNHTPGTIENFPAIGCSGGLQSEFYTGLLDEIAIYNRIVTPDEIRNHYRAGKMN
ncbi:MAG: FecR domain-containing protein [Sedimentisphaerales bacterium]|nr:FecR domain-containing protein [Sedimentisphaerales bacterium]